MTKIAYICADPGIPVFGTKGSSIHVQAILKQFLQHGFEIDLFAMKFDGPDIVGVRKFQIPINDDKSTPDSRERACWAANAHLHTMLLEHGPYDLVYERYSLFSHAALKLAKDQHWPSIVEANSPLIQEAKDHFSLINEDLARSSLDAVLHHADHIVTVSQEVAAAIGAKNAFVVPNGVDETLFRTGLKPSRPSSLFTVGFVGNFRPWHGLSCLASAAKLVSDVRILLVGDGPDRIAFDGLPHVEITGRVSNDAVPSLIASMDVAVCPYPKSENFYFSPLKLFEYMATGVPVIASDIGQIKDIIVDMENGLLIPPGDAIALSRAIEKLRANPDLRKKFALKGRETILAKHSWKKVSDRILSLVF